jgi:uncharacterized protein (TIGR04255 family)
MTLQEVFENPTVKQVVFQIRFPNLFYLDSRIGEFQMQVMEKFPDSEVQLQKQIIFAGVSDSSSVPPLDPDDDSPDIKRVWTFNAPDGVQLAIENSSLSLTSSTHKTYDNPASEHKFRDAIQFAVDTFLDLVRVPVVKRLGLRYIDHCPLPTQDSDTLRAYYNTSFPLERFPVEDATAMSFSTVIRRGAFSVRYRESLESDTEGPFLKLDFDGFTQQLPARDYLTSTDEIHRLIGDEFERTIKQPVIDHMRNQPEGPQH